jgi:hypothetical protein
MIQSMLDDPREIEFVCFDDADGSFFQVGVQECTKIAVYREAGQGGYVPFVAVYENDSLRWRFPASMVQIRYRKEQK